MVIFFLNTQTAVHDAYRHIIEDGATEVQTKNEEIKLK